jgi:hypothetical protein
MAAIAIAFIVFTSPERESATAHSPSLPVVEQDDSSLRDLTSAIGELQQSVDQRLSDVETRFTSLEAPAAEVFDDARLAALEDRVTELETKVATYEPKTAAKSSDTGVSSGGSSGGLTIAPAPLPSVVEYTPRWKNYDGMSFEEHARVMHGIDTDGMTTSQIAMLRDADHDTFGGSHPPAMRSRSRTTTVTAASDCPGGVCPTSSMTTSRTVQSRGGLLGFGILGRRR